MSSDVIIVGAGLSGLIAAKQLKKIGIQKIEISKRPSEFFLAKQVLQSKT